MRKLLVLIVAGLVVFAGCSDDEPTIADESPDATAETTTATTPADDDDMTAAADCQDATEAEGQADLEMQDNMFAPACLRISGAQGLRIHNEGRNEHNFTVEGFGLDVDVSPGDENNTEPTGLEPGTYTFFCKYHRASDDMEGKLVVASGEGS